MSSWELHQGDCLEVLKGLPDASMDSVVTDPPAGISFMGRKWDDDKGGRKHWIAWLTDVLGECLRVLKPGGHAVVWALPRTSHWTATAIEDAGFEIRDVITHVFGSGFPKNLDIAKAIDKKLGVNGTPVAQEPQNGAKFKVTAETIANGGFNDPERASFVRTKPTSPEARRWQGFGTATKPAAEFWILARKPIDESSIAAQVLATGTGALNIDACRVGSRKQTVVRGRNHDRSAYGKFAHDEKIETFIYDGGRWPTNFVMSHSGDCELKGAKRVDSNSSGTQHGAPSPFGKKRDGTVTRIGFAEDDGTEIVEDWRCAPWCPVVELDMQSGESKASPARRKEPTGAVIATDYTDKGGASRFFPTFRYLAKPARSEKDEGLEHLPAKQGGEATGRKEGSDGLNSPRAGAGRKGGIRNGHPTVKPLQLMAWLIKLITPPGGVVLDPFMGSGTTGVAAIYEGFYFVGIEQQSDYMEIAEARLQAARLKTDPFALPLFESLAKEPEQLDLFEDAAW